MGAEVKAPNAIGSVKASTSVTIGLED